MGLHALPGVADIIPVPANEANGNGANVIASGTFIAIGPGKAVPIYGSFNVSSWAAYNTGLTPSAGANSFSVDSGGAIAVGNAINSTAYPPGTTVLTISGTSGTVAFPTMFARAQCSSGSPTLRNFKAPGSMTLAQFVGATVRGGGVASGTTVSAVAANGTDLTLSANCAVTTNNGQWTFFEFDLGVACVLNSTKDAAALFTGAAIVNNASLQLEKSFDGGATWLVANIALAGTLAQWTAHTTLNISLSEPEKNVLYRLNCYAFAAITTTSINYRISATGQAGTSLNVPAGI